MSISNKQYVKSIIKDINNKNIPCSSDEKLKVEVDYHTLYAKDFYINNLDKFEVAQILHANDFYFKKKNSLPKSFKLNPGQIIMVEFGLNFNKLAYNHPAVVISDIGDRVLVAPCTSGNAPTYEKGSKAGQIMPGYMEANSSNGFSHDTCIIIKEVTCIDKTQIVEPLISNRRELRKNKKSGNKNNVKPIYKTIDNSKYINIKDTFLQLYFANEYKYIRNLERDINEANEKLAVKEDEVDKLNDIINNLKEELNCANQKLSEQNFKLEELIKLLKYSKTEIDNLSQKLSVFNEEDEILEQIATTKVQPEEN